MPNDQSPHPIEAMQSAMSDPEVVKQVQAQLLRYQPSVARLGELVEDQDPIAVACVKEIGCFVCDLCDRLGVEYDPAIGGVLLQWVGAMMSESPEKWEKYTREIAPQCNANKLRMTRARSSG